MTRLLTKSGISMSVGHRQPYNSFVVIKTLSHYMQAQINPNNASLHARSLATVQSLIDVDQVIHCWGYYCLRITIQSCGC